MKGPIVGITLATRHHSVGQNNNGQQQLLVLTVTANNSNNSTTTSSSSSSSPPIFLLLVDDNRGTTEPGAYAAHLVTVKNGSFHKLPPAPSTTTTDTNDTMDSTSLDKTTTPSHTRGVGSGSGWFGESSNTLTGGVGGGGLSTPKNVISTTTAATPGSSIAMSNNASSTASPSSLGTLPRMSCATYHPHTGFVYAAGTGVFGLPSVAVKAVLAGMMTNESSSSSSPQTDSNMAPIATAIVDEFFDRSLYVDGAMSIPM